MRPNITESGVFGTVDTKSGQLVAGMVLQKDILIESGNFEYDDDDAGGEPAEQQTSTFEKMPSFENIDKGEKSASLTERRGNASAFERLTKKRVTLPGHDAKLKQNNGSMLMNRP